MKDVDEIWCECINAITDSLGMRRNILTNQQIIALEAQSQGVKDIFSHYGLNVSDLS